MKLFFSKSALFLLILSLQACGRLEQPETGQKPPVKLVEPYTKFDLEDIKAVVIKCDLGRMKVNIRQYIKPSIEIHKTYQKYVHLEPREDTLYIYTDKTPRTTDELRVRKNINLFLPSLKYIRSNVSQIIMADFEQRDMTIENNSNALRLYNCRIQNLDILNKGLCNIQLDGNNYFESLAVKLNEESYYNSDAMVLKGFTLETKSLEHINFTNLPENGFNWIKK